MKDVAMEGHVAMSLPQCLTFRVVPTPAPTQGYNAVLDEFRPIPIVSHGFERALQHSRIFLPVCCMGCSVPLRCSTRRFVARIAILKWEVCMSKRIAALYFVHGGLH